MIFRTPRRPCLALIALAFAGFACSSAKDATPPARQGGAIQTAGGAGGNAQGSGGAGGTTSVVSGSGGATSIPSTGGTTSPASTGGASSVPSGTGGKTVPSGTGGATAIPGAGGATSTTGGATSTTSKTGGATTIPSSGGMQGTGGLTSQSGGIVATGGATKGTGGAGSGGTIAPAGGSSSATGGASSTGGSGGTTSTVPLPPPVRDTASKVPISSPPPGYAVEGNYPYGLLTSQRIDILYPTGGGPKATTALPVVLMFHGGAWIHSYTNSYPSGKDHMSTFFNRFLAHGFIVCNAEYRVNDGTVDGAPAPAAVEDALLAAKWCWDTMDYFHGDRTKYVVTGASAGGHLALMVGMTSAASGLGPTSPTDFKIAGIVDGYGPADIEAEINAVAAGWLPTTLPNRLAIAKQVNPMTYVRKDIPPLIVVQGANDNTAPVADSRKLVANLTAAGAEATMHEVAGAGHGFASPAAAWPDAEKAMFDWLTAKGMGK